MITSDSIWTIVFSLGTVQGIFLVVVLMHRQSPNRLASALLAGLVLVFVLGIAEELIEVAHLSSAFPHVLLSTTTVAFLIGPCMYLYGSVLLSGKTSLSRTDLLHFTVFILSTMYFVPFYILPGSEKIAILRDASFSTVTVTFATLKGVHLLGYFAAIFVVLSRARAGEQSSSRPQIRRLLWFRRSTTVLTLIAVLSGLLYYWSLWERSGLNSDYLPNALLTLVIYSWVIVAMRDPDTLFLSRFHEIATVTTGSRRLRGPAAYMTSPLDEREKSDLVRNIRLHMELEQPYLDPDLRQSDLADGLEISPHHLSQILNESMGMNYSEFINSYRVDEFMRRVRDPEHQHYTILAIAYESGFKSKSSFNRIFKAREGLTAREFRNLAPGLKPIPANGANRSHETRI